MRKGLAELFSGLFYVAASRLNSPRLSRDIETSLALTVKMKQYVEAIDSMRRAIYPGSFDPVTNGHLDIIERGCKLFDEIIIAILVNPEKIPFFTIDERQEMLAEVLKEIERGSCRLRVDSFQGLLVHYAVAQQADAIVRGIRAISDYEYELQMALMNRRLEPRIETVFMMPAEAYSYVSSRLVKEVFLLGGELDGLVPGLVETRMKEKVAKG
jgi:pantetheine-phosphate adenylyltransferase